MIGLTVAVLLLFCAVIILVRLLLLTDLEVGLLKAENAANRRAIAKLQKQVDSLQEDFDDFTEDCK